MNCLNCFERCALIYLLKHTHAVTFMETKNPKYYDIVIDKRVCKSMHKDELFNIFLNLYEVK